MEHLDLDVAAQKPQDLATIQPVDITSPMGASKIPHQPATPNLNVNPAPGQGQKPGSNFIMVN